MAVTLIPKLEGRNPSPPASTSTTPESTDASRVDAASIDSGHLPDSVNQPILLDTIDAVKTLVDNEHQQRSPGSTEEKEPLTIKTTQRGSPLAYKSARKTPQHRRTVSAGTSPSPAFLSVYGQPPSPVVQPVVSDRQQPPRPSRPSHHRSNSFPNAPMAGPFSAAGNPLIPIMTDGPIGQPPLPVISPLSGGRRRRTYSGTLPPPGPVYGSFDETPSTTSSSYRPNQWSPRSEIMSLTQKFQRPPESPRPRNPISPRASPHPSPRSSLRVNFSPQVANLDQFPGQSSLRNLQWQTQQQTAEPSESDSLLNTPRGEAVFAAQKRGKRKSDPQRKMHMRQASAQLFMEDCRGVEQPKACHDIMFLLLFLFHLVGLAFLGKTYGPDAFVLDEEAESEDKVRITMSYFNVIYVACLCGGFAIFLSAIALILMTWMTKRLVQVALCLTIAASFAWGTVGIGLSPKSFVPITGIIALALSVGYTFVVWDRIPFAASNLSAGLAGVRSNAGCVIVAFVFQALALGCTIYYVYVTAGVYDAIQTGHLNLSHGMQTALYATLGVSCYWVFNVMMNVVRVTVAGTIQHWWFSAGDQAPSFWNSNVRTSFFTAMFYSLGSICFGSLVVGPVRLLRMMAAFFRPNHEESMLSCFHECVHMVQQCFSGCVDSLAAQFNTWSFTYIGLYGYGLLDAGQNATALFEKRGWATIIKDDLVSNVLLLLSLVIGGVTGCTAVLMQQMHNMAFSSLQHPQTVAFLIGFVIGWVLTSVLFAMISSSVSAVIVCFAGSPVEFEQNHPELSREMRSAWRGVWPGCMDVVDMRVTMASGVLSV